MKILHISTYDIKGGAARAAYRLHQGLRQMGHDCRMVVRDKDSADDSVLRTTSDPERGRDDQAFFLNAVIQGQYIDAHRTDISNTMFSFPYPGYDLSGLSVVREADVINLHWVARYQSPLTLKRLFDLGKPVVWTLHDQWPFTGGCHYTAGCEHYQNDCDGCPQLSDDPFGLPGAALKDKREFFQNAGLTLVSPSRWLGECARKSRLFRSLRVEVIPNALNTDVFTPQPKEDAKRCVGISPETLTILFGAESGDEKRKGFQELVAALRYCHGQSWFRKRIRSNKVKFLCFGHPGKELTEMGIPLISLDYLDSDDKMIEAYRAADVFIQPSIEDNLPNTMLEAMSCGTPVVAFDVGGMHDIVMDDLTGWLVPLRDIDGMAEKILSLVSDPVSLSAMQQHCRGQAEARFSLPVQARRYIDLYAGLVHKCRALASRCGETDLEPGPTFSIMATNTCPVPVVTQVGRHIESILDPILLIGLKALAPLLHMELNRCQADRTEGFKAVHEYRKRLEEMTFQWERSEEDRAARLKCIHEHENDRERLWKELQSSESEKNRIVAERDRYADELQELQTRIERSEADKTALQELIRFQEDEIEACKERLDGIGACLRENEVKRKEQLLSIDQYHKRLSDLYEDLQTYEQGEPSLMDILSHAQGHLIEVGRLLREGQPDRCWEVNPSPVDFYYTALNRAYLSALHALKLLRHGNDGEDYPPTAAIHSHKVETFVNARNQRGDVEDGALEFLYDMGQTLRKVICMTPTDRNIKVLYIFRQTGADVSCFSGDTGSTEHLTSLGITAIPNDLAQWLIRTGQTAFAGYDAVVLDAEVGEIALGLMKGRLWPRNRMLITGTGVNLGSHQGAGGIEGETVFGMKVLGKPPVDWIDPFCRERSIYLQMAWPWKGEVCQFPPTLPSGRPWPRISVVTATRNQGDYLEETLRSVLMQGYPNLEYIVIDGASTDTTGVVLERYRGRLTHCVREKDNGQSDALNKGFHLATGDILAWLNSDDRYLPWTLMRVALAFDVYDSDMVAGGCALVKDREEEAFRIHHNALAVGKKIALPVERLLDIDGSWQQGDFFFQPEVFWRRRMWEITGGKLAEDLFYSMDYELWVRMAAQGASIVHVPDTLALFRIHEKQKTSGLELPFLHELRQVNARLRAGVK